MQLFFLPMRHWLRQIVRLATGFILVAIFLSLLHQTTLAAKAELAPADDYIMPAGYNTGTPGLVELWVDPINGNDSNSGTSAASPLRTVDEAWGRIPQGITLTTGVRINLKPGYYPAAILPNYWEYRYGTFAAPIFIQGKGSRPGQVVLQGNVNMYDVSYVYFDNLSIFNNGDAFHCELCNHLLLRKVILNGGAANQAQETVKVNQSKYVYIENSDISHAWDNVIDFVAVQYGHIINNRIHEAQDWCAYNKGGSAYIRVEANEIYNCGTGGFTAGQGTGFQFMTAPWLQYEAYDIKVVNNLIHDTDGAGLGVNGGYNILLADNTLYRVGKRSHVIEVVFGMRSCDGQPGDPGRERCQTYLKAGGWGTTAVDNGTNAINIPNKNVFIFNNVVYNPPGYQSLWQHFAIYEPRANPTSSHAPNPAVTDDNLEIRGNVIWNGSAWMPLGIEGTDACAVSNPTCNENQLRADNAINNIKPEFANAAAGEFHPTGGWATGVTTYNIPDFGWTINGVPTGDKSNDVPIDFEGVNRLGTNPPGAYFTIIDVITAPPFTSNAAQDGGMLELFETSNVGGSINSAATAFNLGDDTAKRQYRGILSFSTGSSLPDNAVITSVMLKVRQQAITGGGNPVSTFGGFMADVKNGFFGTTTALQASDFQAAANASYGPFVLASVGGWYNINLTGAKAYINKLATNSGLTQIRLRLKLDDNNNAIANYLSLYSGNAAAASRPQLVISYTVP